MGATGAVLTHQQGRVGVLGVEGALTLPVQEGLSSAAGHQREVLQVLWERGGKSSNSVKTHPKSARCGCGVPLACGEAAVLTPCTARGETEAGQAAWGHLREQGPQIRGLPPAPALAREKLPVRNTMSSSSAAARRAGTSCAAMSSTSHPAGAPHGSAATRRESPPRPRPRRGDTHDVGAGGAEGVGPADVEVGLVQRHEDPDEVEAFGLQRGKSGDGG